MRKTAYYLSCFLTVFLFLGTRTSVFAIDSIRWDEDGCINISSDVNTDDFKGYTLFEGDRYYGLCPMKGADEKTFKLLDFVLNNEKRFAKDKNHVYFMSKVIKDINPATLKIEDYEMKATSTKFDTTEFKRFLIRDNDTVYIWSGYGGILVNGINLDDFTIRGSGIDTNKDAHYSDKVHIYQKTEHKDKGYATYYTLNIVEGADPAHFYFGYDVTDETVYWYGKKIEEADPATFKVRLEWSNEIATDKNNVYEKGKVMYGVDVKSFQIYQIDTGKNTGTVFPLSETNVAIFKGQYPSSTGEMQMGIKSNIRTYEAKYPGYTPQPAIPKPGSPEEQELKKFQAEVAKAKLDEAEERKQNLIRWGGIMAGSLVLGSLGYAAIRRKMK